MTWVIYAKQRLLNSLALPNSLPANRGFKIASLNVNSLIKHIDDLRIFLADNPVDVLAINESKLDVSIKNCELYIPGYEIARRDRNRNGGSVCFYIKTSINFLILRDLNLNDLENLCLEIQKPCSKPFIVVTWWRPPCSSAELFSYYETLIGKLDSLDLEQYLMGDLNCNMAFAHFDSNTRLLREISDIYIWATEAYNRTNSYYWVIVVFNWCNIYKLYWQGSLFRSFAYWH